MLSLHRLISKTLRKGFGLLCLLLHGGTVPAQTGFLTEAPPARRLQVLWQYCDKQSVSDQDSAVAHRFLTAIIHTADSLHDGQLKKYARYFRLCSSLLFSDRYERYFPEDDYRKAVAVFERAKAWALEEGYADIVASCNHYISRIYYRADQFGPAFDHLLKAQESFQKIGYEHVPNASRYLLQMGLSYYRFKELDKALDAFLTAIRYPFFLPREEINTYNTIALIYNRKKDPDNAMRFYRKTIATAAAYNDATWVGIASGNLGTVFLQQGQPDSALFYHRINYTINSAANSEALEDAALTALAMAAAFTQTRRPDSALHYIYSGRNLLKRKTTETTPYLLEFRKRLLTVQIELSKTKGDYRAVSLLSDSLTVVKDSLQQLLDADILGRAVQKAEVERYATALKLLEMEKNLNRWRLYIAIATFLFIIVTGGLLFNRFRMRKQRQVELAEREKQLLSIEKKHTEESLKHAEELLSAYLTTIKEKTTLIENLDAELERLKTFNEAYGFEDVAANMENLISSTILTDEDWRHFRQLFERVHPGFLYRLKEKFPDLSAAESRLLLLTKLKLPSREMAHMLGISIDAIRKSRYRVRKKLKLEPEQDIEEAIVEV